MGRKPLEWLAKSVERRVCSLSIKSAISVYISAWEFLILIAKAELTQNADRVNMLIKYR